MARVQVTSVAVIVPVLQRPRRVAPLLASLRAADEPEITTTPVFVCSDGDRLEIQAVRAAGLEPLILYSPGRSEYSRKCNLAAASVDDEWLFLGADDLHFHPGWARACLDKHIETGCRVIGTNDLGNSAVMAGRHSTHSLVHRDYLVRGTIDQPDRLLHEGYDHNSCNPPDAPIWMADLSFKPLGQVEVGDELMGWHRPTLNPADDEVIKSISRAEGSNREVAELVGVSATYVQAVRAGTRAAGTHKWKAPLRRLCSSEVLAVQHRVAPLVRVRMESGREIRCTPDHNWLNAAWSPSSSHDRQWVNATIGRSLLHVIDEPTALPPEHERLAAWLGGIYDGEGSSVYVASQSILRNPEVCQAIADALVTLGIPSSMPSGFSEGVRLFNMKGGRQTFLNFLAWCQPVKRWRLEKKILNTSRFGLRDRVVAVEPDGEGEVVSMTTTTGNYVAWGYASKNCDVEFVETAKARGQFAFAADAHVEHLHRLWGKAPMDQVYRKGIRNATADKRLYLSRRRLWTKHAANAR